MDDFNNHPRTTISNRARALIRDLANISVVADSLDKIGNLEQAERETKARVEALKQTEAEALDRIAKESEQAQARAADTLHQLEGEIKTAQTRKAQLDHQVSLATKTLAQALEEGEKAKAELQQTRDQLFKIASRIGG